MARLDAGKDMILKHEEESWRLKSRATWLSQGDNNTKFFHNYANQRRITNSIWKIKDAGGELDSDKKYLEKDAVQHFKEVYSKDRAVSFEAQMKILQHIPRFFSEEEGVKVGEEVSLDEIERALNCFGKSKSPGPDGWTVECFLHFFEMLGKDLLDAVDFSRINGYIACSVNATFIALIPKREKPESYDDYRPISLCNLVYKLIYKIISLRIKSFLTSGISKEQFGFLSNRQILDAIGVGLRRAFTL